MAAGDRKLVQLDSCFVCVDRHGRERHISLADGNWQVIESCSILTTTANKLMAPIHDRMPVILPGREDVGVWLDVGSSQGDISGLLLPCPSKVLIKYPVSEYFRTPGRSALSLCNNNADYK